MAETQRARAEDLRARAIEIDPTFAAAQSSVSSVASSPPAQTGLPNASAAPLDSKVRAMIDSLVQQSACAAPIPAAPAPPLARELTAEEAYQAEVEAAARRISTGEGYEAFAKAEAAERSKQRAEDERQSAQYETAEAVARRIEAA
jgi:hypothetical protein